MTEDEWLACADPEAMFELLKGKASERKFRLLHCACIRCVVPLVIGLDGNHLLSVAEDHADGTATLKGIVEATSALNRYAQRLRPTTGR